MARPPKEIRTRLHSGTKNYMIGFLEEPGRWHSTPESTIPKAIAWAKRNRARLLADAPDGKLRLKDCARGLFDEGSPWRKRQEAKGHTYSDAYMAVRAGHLANYIIPLFGDDDPRELHRRYVDDALLDVSKTGRPTPDADGHQRTPKALAPATMHKIVYTLNLVLEELVDRGIIERNPIEGIRPYSKAPVKPRDALPPEAIAKLFPAGHGPLVRNWGSTMWAACMCMLLDTGMRPGELRALKWGQIDAEDRFIPIRYGIAAGTTDTRKTTKTGIVRAGFISYRTAQELEIWRRESKYNLADDYIFTITGEKPVTNEGIVKAFRYGVARTGIDHPEWTPYWLRHSFGTHHLAELDDSEILLLMGHTNLITNLRYRHPDDETIRKRALGVQKKLDASRESQAPKLPDAY